MSFPNAEEAASPSPASPSPASPSSDEIIGRSAMRKATRRLIPIIGIGYGVAYMDRVNIGLASLQMNRDLHFSATIYSLGAGLFFLSYSALEIPSNLLLYRVGARRWLARIMITWGVLAMAMMFVRTPVQFYVMRFLLGAAEAGFFPGVLFYLTQWFPTNLRARTISRFYVSLPLSAVLMGAIGGALMSLEGTLGIHGWQWLFLVEGMPAIVLSLIFFLFLPDTPHQAKWLTIPERDWIESQLAAEGAGTPGSHSTGVASALGNIRVWLFGLTNFLMLGVSYGSTFFLPAILQNLTTLSITRIGFVISAFGLLGAAAMLLNAWLSDRSGKSYLHIIVPALLEVFCLLLVAVFKNPWLCVPALAAMYLAHNAIQAPLLAVPTTFLRGKGAAAGLATINMIGILGGLVFPAMMGTLRDLTGSYQVGLGVLASTMLASVGVVLVLRSLSRRRTREANACVHP